MMRTRALVLLAGAALCALPLQRGASVLAAQSARTPARGAVRGSAHGTLHTDTLWSQSLGIRKALVVYLPPSYAASPSRRYPVLFYLHGLSGNERNWSEQGALAATLDSLAAAGAGEAIVAMPDGDDGWYTTWNGLADARCRSDTTRKEPADQFCVPWQHYDDYVARDLVSHVDAHYRTRATRASRGIAGLSMGGYGAVTLALSYPGVFAAAASHSGVVSPRLLGPHPYPAAGSGSSVTPRYATDSAGLRQASTWLWRYMAPPFGRDTTRGMLATRGALPRVSVAVHRPEA
jgi:S-formylglutathione hydrolase FrmB